jgi:hypothetical protein
MGFESLLDKFKRIVNEVNVTQGLVNYNLIFEVAVTITAIVRVQSPHNLTHKITSYPNTIDDDGLGVIFKLCNDVPALVTEILKGINEGKNMVKWEAQSRSIIFVKSE